MKSIVNTETAVESDPRFWSEEASARPGRRRIRARIGGLHCSLCTGTIEKALGGTVRQKVSLQKGIPSEKAREIVKIVKGTKLKVQSAYQGDAVRITGAKRDELQAAIALLRKEVAELPLAYNNFRE